MPESTSNSQFKKKPDYYWNIQLGSDSVKDILFVHQYLV